MDVGVPGASRGHTEAGRKVWPHSESGGPTSPHPPTKAIAHRPFWPFSAGRFWDGAVWALVFGHGCARGIPRVHGGRSKNLAPFRVRQTNFAPPPHLGYSAPPFRPFSAGRFRDGVVGALVFGRGCARGIPRAHGGRSQSLAPFRVRRTNFAPPPTKAIAHPPFWPFSAGRFWDGGLRALAFGRSCGRGIPRVHAGRSQSLAPF